MSGVTISRRTAVSLCAALMAAPFVSAAAGRAGADESGGWYSLSGVAGIDETIAFPSLVEVAEAIALSVPAEQPADSGEAPVVTVFVHGTAVLEERDYDLSYPVDGAVVAVLGADAASSLATANGGALRLSCTTGSLVVRCIGMGDAAVLSARDHLVVDSCSCAHGVSCAAGGSVGIAGNTFCGAGPDEGPSLTIDLTGADAVLDVSGNAVSGFPCGIVVRCSTAECRTAVRMTSNRFFFDPLWTEEGPKAFILWLAGGPWGPGSIVRDNNVAENATELLVLGESFSASVPADREGAYGEWDSEGARFIQRVSDDNLAASTLIALFELTGRGVSQLPDALVAVDVDPRANAPYAREQAREASAVLLPALPGVSAGATYTVRYDANGAMGVAPDAVVVAQGSSVAAETMGSLVAPGFVFEGWNTQADGSGSFYASGQVFVPQCDTVLYAQWTATGTVAMVSVGTAESGA